MEERDGLVLDKKGHEERMRRKEGPVSGGKTRKGIKVCEYCRESEQIPAGLLDRRVCHWCVSGVFKASGDAAAPSEIVQVVDTHRSMHMSPGSHMAVYTVKLVVC